MPYAKVNGVNLYYEEKGSGEEVIVFSHGLLWSHKMFADQVDFLKANYKIYAYDHRGQGQSEVTPDGYDMETIYRDALAFIQHVVGKPCHFVGLSMGGFVAMRLAARNPEWIKSIMLLETSADPEPTENVPKYSRLKTVVNWFGAWVVTKPVMKIMFGQKFLNDPSRKDVRKKWFTEFKKNKKTITRSVEAVMYRKGVFEELKKITCPTLIVVGTQDTATVPAKSERMHSQIVQSKLVYIDGAGHSSSIEEPTQVNQALQSFLEAQTHLS